MFYIVLPIFILDTVQLCFKYPSVLFAMCGPYPSEVLISLGHDDLIWNLLMNFNPLDVMKNVPYFTVKRYN